MDVHDFCDLLGEESFAPPPRPVKVDPLEGYPERELREHLFEEFQRMHETQGRLHLEFAHKMSWDCKPEQLFERLSFLLVDARVEAWNAAKGRRLKTLHLQGRYPDIGIYEGDNLVLGVEVKTYNLMCKEQSPTARFKGSSALFGQGDMLVLVCYVWKYLFPDSGTPVLFPSFVGSVPELVRFRDNYWKNNRGKGGGSLEEIQRTDDAGLRDRVNAHDPLDVGNNLGRLGRGIVPIDRHIRGVMDICYAPDGQRQAVRLSTFASTLNGT